MPKTFKDLDGREWSLRINIGAMRRCKQRGIDLSMPVVQLREFIMDDVFFTDCLFSIVEPEAKERKIDLDTFEVSINGDVLTEARSKLWEALTEFYGSDPKAEMLRESLAAMDRETAAALSLISSATGANSKGNSDTESTT